MRNANQVFTNQTTTGTSIELTRSQLTRGGMNLPIIAKVTASGVTAALSVTVQIESYRAEEWVAASDPLTIVGTAKDGVAQYIYGNALKKGVKSRLNITTISAGVTVTSAYIGMGTVEN